MEIVVKKWYVEEDEKTKVKTVAGVYEVRSGKEVIASQTFNGSSYGSADIPLPPEIMVKVNAIDEEIRQAIVDNFNA